jgi:hypothetical protein
MPQSRCPARDPLDHAPDLRGAMSYLAVVQEAERGVVGAG